MPCAPASAAGLLAGLGPFAQLLFGQFVDHVVLVDIADVIHGFAADDARRRLLVCIVVGVAVGLLLPSSWRPSSRLLIGWDSALALYDLSDLLPNEIHLTVPRTASRRHPGLRLHTTRLELADATQYAGLPVTTVARTIADVAASGLSEELIGQAIEEAVRRGLTTVDQLHAAASRRGRRAASVIEQALTAGKG